jgi:hypothetical protein
MGVERYQSALERVRGLPARELVLRDLRVPPGNCWYEGGDGVIVFCRASIFRHFPELWDEKDGYPIHFKLRPRTDPVPEGWVVGKCSYNTTAKMAQLFEDAGFSDGEPCMWRAEAA